jgi:hypothetical protein
MMCNNKNLDCNKTQNPNWTLKLSLILGHKFSRAICTFDHGEPSKQRFSYVIIIAQNPSTQSVFICVKKQLPLFFFGSLFCLFVFATCLLIFVFGCSLLVDFSFLLGIKNVFVSKDFLLVTKVRPHNDCWNNYRYLCGPSQSNFLCSVKKSNKGETLL